MKQSKRTRLQARLNSLVTLLLLLAAFGLLAWASTQYTIEQDWTRDGRHTLADASVQVLERLDEPVTITAYARDDKSLRDAIRNFIGRYQRFKPDIDLAFVNPERVPDRVRELGISVNGELVLHYRDRSEHVKNITEQSLTNALRRLARGVERQLVFLSGHGERDPEGQANHDLRYWARQLDDSGFRISRFNPDEGRELPDNISVLVLAGPEIDPFPGTIKLIRRYIADGGNLLWLSDPGDQHGLEALAPALGIEFPEGMVVDFAGQMLGIDDLTIALVTPGLYGEHAITENFEFPSIYPQARGLLADADNNEWQATPFIQTGDHTWLETGSLDEEASYDADTEIAGPITIGMALERTVDEREQRVVVVGDGDFLSNTYAGNGGNLELGNRIINWLSADDELISIPASTASDTRLILSNTAAIAIGFGFLLVLPGGLFATGLIIWWRRRKR